MSILRERSKKAVSCMITIDANLQRSNCPACANKQFIQAHAVSKYGSKKEEDSQQ